MKAGGTSPPSIPMGRMGARVMDGSFIVANRERKVMQTSGPAKKPAELVIEDIYRVARR